MKLGKNTSNDFLISRELKVNKKLLFQLKSCSISEERVNLNGKKLKLIYRNN